MCYIVVKFAAKLGRKLSVYADSAKKQVFSTKGLILLWHFNDVPPIVNWRLITMCRQLSIGV